MGLLTVRQYEHASRLTTEVGKLLGAWLEQEKKPLQTVTTGNRPAVGVD